MRSSIKCGERLFILFNGGQSRLSADYKHVLQAELPVSYASGQSKLDGYKYSLDLYSDHNAFTVPNNLFLPNQKMPVSTFGPSAQSTPFYDNVYPT